MACFVGTKNRDALGACPSRSQRMDRTLVHGEGGLFERLRQSRVGVDGAGDILGASAILHVRDGGRDNLGGVFPDHLDAENPVCFGVGDDLDKTVRAIDGEGASVGGERKFADPDVDAALLRLLFPETGAGDFRLGVDALGMTS